MKNKILSVALMAMASMANAISVYTLDEQFSQTNQTVLRFRVENNTADTLNGLELRYQAVQDTAMIAAPDLYYLPEGMANWSFEDATNATLVIYFPNVVLYPGDVLGGNSGYALGLHNKDWSTWTKNDDPSQPASNVFTLADNVDVLSGGVSLMHDVGTTVGCPVVQFVEVAKDSISLQVLQQLDTDTSAIVVKNKEGSEIVADLNQASLDAFGQRVWRGSMMTQDTAEHRGELRAECGGNTIAYFAFGWEPTGAEDAVAKSLWASTNAFVKADFDMGFNQGLIDGQRLILQRDSSGNYLDARQVANWKFYRSWEEPGENTMPVILSSAIMQYNAADIDSLSFAWSTIDSVDLYHLVVVEVSKVGDSLVYGDTIVSKATELSSVNIATLPAGNYVWFVEPLVEVALDENEEGAEYYYVNGDMVSHEMRRGLWKKVKKWAKKTVKKATQVFTPIVYTAVYGGNLMDNITYSFSHVNPIGIIQIFLPTITLRTQTNSVPKHMDYLQYSYSNAYRYTSPITGATTETMNNFNGCYGAGKFCAMKDTRMLAESWENGFSEANWGMTFPKLSQNGTLNYGAKNRCWLTMAQMLNHFAGGSISSDEIQYYVNNHLSSDGATNGGNAVETMQAVNYALDMGAWEQAAYTWYLNEFHAKGVIPTLSGWTAGTPMLHTIIRVIEEGNVLGVSQLNSGTNDKGEWQAHSMVLNGYKIESSGDVYIHLLNTDNMGKAEWRYYCNISSFGVDIIVSTILNGIGHLIDLIPGVTTSGNMFFAFYEPPHPSLHKYLPTNPNVFVDSDLDGIVNFDETLRFGTDPLKKDSDDDTIEDLDEIKDFMQCFNGISYGNSDIDGDQFLAARDLDTDGDGYCDYQESGFGVSGAHHCERYNAAIHPEGEIPACAGYDYSLALLAKERLTLNDRTSCVAFWDGSYCPVASYGTDYVGDYGVTLGVASSIGNIYSAKSVLLRDRALVFGNIETAGTLSMQSSTVGIAGTVTQNSPRASAFAALYGPVLDNAVLLGDFTILSSNTYNPGDVVYSSVLGVGANQREFVFNSGSTLMFNHTGDHIAGSLKFQANSNFVVPAEGNVILHVGDEFQWNGVMVADNMITAAQKIIVYYYGTKTVHIQTNFAGTIIAPNAHVIVGQSGKNYYGAIFAKSIVVHQDTRITWVPFVLQQNNSVIAYATDRNNLNYSINFLEI